MDFSLSEDQEALRESVRRYCRNELAQQAAGNAEQGAGNAGGNALSDRRHWAAMADLGWLGVLVPETNGGVGGTIIDASIILEEFGRNLVAEPFLPCAVMAAIALRHSPPGEVRDGLLQNVATGRTIVAVAHAERRSQGVVDLTETMAHRDSNGDYVISGHKSFALAGSTADKYLVSARVSDGGRDEGDVAVFAVHRDVPGLARRDFETMDGRGASELVLERAKVGAAARLTPKGEGARTIGIATEYAIAGVCAEAIGAMEDVVTVTAEYLKTRRAYGTTLSTFQALQHRLADMLVELEMSKSIFYRMLAAFSGAGDAARAAAVSGAKALIGGSAKFVGGSGIQLHGAMGMSQHYRIGRHFKQLTMLDALFGNAHAHWQKRACSISMEGAAADEDDDVVQVRSRVRAI